MLYVSTRNKGVCSTAYKTLHEAYAPDGGMFAPLATPFFDNNELSAMKSMTSGQIVKQILNLFFSQQLTSDDVESCIGKDPFRVEILGQRIVVAECWCVGEYNYEHLVDALYNRLCCNENILDPVPQWARIAIEIAVLFALFSELSKNGIECADIVADSTDFTYPMSAWYARKMGLPIGGIICACNDGSEVWELVNHGKVAATGSAEQLIYETLGQEEIAAYMEASAQQGAYQLSEESLPILKQGMSAAVVSEDRIDAVLSSVYRTNSYIADPDAAVSFGALQDHRALTGENNHTLIMSRMSPLPYVARISAATGCSQEKLKSMIRIPKE